MQRKVKVQVVKAKQWVYDDLFARLDTKEGETDLYGLVRQKDTDEKHMQQTQVIKVRDGNVLTDAWSVAGRWKEDFEELMSEENEREHRVEEVTVVDQEVAKISEAEVRRALKRMKREKADGPDDILVEVWKCLGEVAVKFLTRTFKKTLDTERMLEEWRSVPVLIFKNKGDMQSCGICRGTKLMSHIINLWERVVEARIRTEVSVCQQKYGFMPKKEYYRCNICFEDANREAERKSERAVLSAKRGTMVLHEEVWSTREICSSGARHV